MKRRGRKERHGKEAKEGIMESLKEREAETERKRKGDGQTEREGEKEVRRSEGGRWSSRVMMRRRERGEGVRRIGSIGKEM